MFSEEVNETPELVLWQIIIRKFQMSKWWYYRQYSTFKRRHLEKCIHPSWPWILGTSCMSFFRKQRSGGGFYTLQIHLDSRLASSWLARNQEEKQFQRQLQTTGSVGRELMFMQMFSCSSAAWTRQHNPVLWDKPQPKTRCCQQGRMWKSLCFVEGGEGCKYSICCVPW